MFVACKDNVHLCAFFRHWDQLTSDCIANEYHKQMSKLTKCRNVVLGLTLLMIIFVVLNVSISSVLVCLEPISEHTIGRVMVDPFKPSFITLFIFSILQIWITAVGIVTTCFTGLLIYVVNVHFTKLSTVIGKHIKTQTICSWQSLEDASHTHQQLCRGVQLLGGWVKYMMACQYVTNMGLSCFLMYDMVNSPGNEPLATAMKLFWMIITFGTVMMLSIIAARSYASVRLPFS
jgi:hypothetical protein